MTAFHCSLADLLIVDGLAHNIRFRCGLYIVGSETDMQDTDRDRMMVLVFELSEQQLSLWTLLHTDAMKLLDQLKLSGEAGVCVRYYHRVEHSPIGDVVQGSQNTGPIADSYFDLRPGESFDSWMQRRDQFYEHRYGEQQRGRAQREVQSRTEDDHDANEPQVTMYGETGAPSSFMGTEARVSRIPTPLGLESPVNNTATVSAERSTTTRRPTTSGRSLHDHAHLAALTTHPTGGNSETMNTTMDSWNRIPNLLRQNAGVGSAEDRASFYEPDDATDVSVLSIAGSDKEEEALLPRIPEPALEYR